MENEKPYKIINGNSLDVLETFEENSIDAIITDPPYELNFMGKGWDRSGIAYNVELWKKALRVLKHGGYLLAFGGTRTYHRIACAIEDAGFEIRDCIMWLYGSGFPKSLNIGLAIDKKNGVESEIVGTVNAPDLQDVGTQQKALGNGHIQSFGQIENAKRIQYEIKKASNEWDGWGTALKPAYEPIIVARKPVEKTVIDNVLKWGVGGINIDECRVPLENEEKIETGRNGRKTKPMFCFGELQNGETEFQDNGRFPANVIHDGSEEVISGMPDSNGSQGKPFVSTDYKEKETATNFTRGDFNPYNDSGSASRYFYCAKASKKDRDGGLLINNDKNIHPTVKPVELMEYLVKLVAPKGATILDIFNGSGSTGKAVMFENRERDANYKYIGIELDPEYCKISEARIDYALNKCECDMIRDIKEEERKTGQLSLFDFGDDNED